MKLTLVTATIFNAGGDTECGSTEQHKTETLDDAKSQAFEIARELFEDNFSDPRGVIYNVNYVKIPELPSATIESTPEIKPVTLKTS